MRLDKPFNYYQHQFPAAFAVLTSIPKKDLTIPGYISELTLKELLIEVRELAFLQGTRGLDVKEAIQLYIIYHCIDVKHEDEHKEQDEINKQRAKDAQLEW